VHTVIIKIGGQAFEEESNFYALGSALRSMRDRHPIIVHGGGAEISAALQKANRKPVFIDGLRVTTAEDIKIVEQVLSETVNKRIATLLQKAGVRCKRLSGKTENLFVVEPLRRDGHDFGFVGEIKYVNPQCVLQALEQNTVPIISPISADKSGQSFNVNADNAAAALAISLKSDDLVYLTNVPGVQVDDHIQSRLSIEEAKELIERGIINGGMIAKMHSIFEAIHSGVKRVHIAQWDGPDTLDKILNDKHNNGTIIQS